MVQVHLWLQLTKEGVLWMPWLQSTYGRLSVRNVVSEKVFCKVHNPQRGKPQHNYHVVN